MYNHLPRGLKKGIPELIISDSQISTVTKSYYRDEHFPGAADGTINLWNLYNLLTSAVKGSYIDTFLDRNVNAFSFTKGICRALDGGGEFGWFLN